MAAPLASLLGISPAGVRKLLHGSGRVRAATAARVAEVYNELWQRQGCSREAAATARSLGWASPLAWDDDEIDHPLARPHGLRPQPERSAA